MSRNLNTSRTNRPVVDYGATSSSAITDLPTINYSGFSPTEFVSLCDDIAHNMNAIHSSIKQLVKLHKIIGTPRDQQSTRDKVHNIHAETNIRIETTTDDLQRLTSVVRRSDKQQKLQLEKLTNDFRNVVEYYSEIQQLLATAMKQNYLNPQQQQLRIGIQEEDDAETVDIQKQQQQQQRQLEQRLQMEQNILLDRAYQVQRIESDILDVNTIIRKIGNILKAQGEHIDRIENSIESAATDIEMGREQLIKAAASRRSCSCKILIILSIAVIIGLIVTGIIVSKLIN